MSYKITDETLNKILLSSPSALPLSPKEAGMKGTGVKEYFYAFIRLLVKAINESLELAERDYNTIPDKISEHNKREDSELHPFIIGLINGLNDNVEDIFEKIAEFGDTMQEYVDKHNILGEGSEVHPFILGKISEVWKVASDALNLAEGKAKIHPCLTLDSFLQGAEHFSFNVGDIIFFAEKGLPDLIVLEKNTNKQDEDITIEHGFESEHVLEPGRTYYIKGHRFVSQESGYDHSKLALKTELEVLASEVALKEYAKTVKTETAETVILTNKTEFNLGLRTSVVVALPENVDEDFESIINFRSGSVATSFDAPTELVFCQDDCNDGHFYPYSNRIYEINIKNVGGVLVARVGGADYEVVE